MTNEEDEKRIMKRNKMIIENHQGTTVAILETLNNNLHGHAKWYNPKGEEVASGEFRDGKPWSGTLLNWSRYIDGDPFSLDHYAKDWVTFFESMYDSEIPDYDTVKEKYQDGILIR